ncbi:hypothetical protein QPK87_04810 [Kamptonema cortianum]|nr:hypothetical protein [Geitlerinema splendidum]MDK3155897.1 hypothetical protein [Kamptonema cortianum]
MSRLTGLDVSVFDIDSASFLADLRGVTLESTADVVDATPLSLAGKKVEPVRRKVQLEARMTSEKPGGAKVTHLDLSSLSIGGTNYVPVLREGVFAGRNRWKSAAGVSDEWEYPVVVQKDYAAEVVIALEPGMSQQAAQAAFGSVTGSKIGFGLTLNGVAVVLPMVLVKWEHVMSVGDVQTWRLRLKGSAPIGAVYPSSPLGTGTLLSRAMNDPGGLFGIQVISRGTGGQLYDGQFLCEEFEFGFSDRSVVETRFKFVSQGAVTRVAT